MKRPRLRLCWVLPLAVVLVPPAFWGLVLAITPTEWARAKVVARFREATGRTISLGRLWIGVFGGVHLSGLAIGAPNAQRNPWLKIDAARINVSVLQLLAGQVEPSEVEVEGGHLRVLRRRDGTFELADLLRPAPTGKSSTAEAEKECPGGPAGLEVLLHDAHVTVIDEPSRTRLELTGVEGRATWEGHRATVHELRGTVNGGPFELAASVERVEGGPAFEGHLRAHQVSLNGATSVLSYLVPVLSDLPGPGSVDGRLDVNLFVRGQGATRADLRRTLIGQGSVRLDPVTLDRSRFLAELDALVDLPNSARVGSVKGELLIKNGRIRTDNLTLDLANIPLVLSGWTDFDRRVDYRVGLENVANRIPDKARDFLADIAGDLKDVTTLRMAGTLDAMHVTFSGAPRDALATPGEPMRKSHDRKKLRELGRRVRDRFLR